MVSISRLLMKIYPEGAFGGLAASSYDKHAAHVFQEFYTYIATEVMVEKRDAWVLDIGTGPAYLPIEIAKVTQEAHIVGIDISEKMLDMAKKNVLKAGLTDRITLEQGDANHLKYHHDSFDIVIITWVLHMCKNPVRVLNETYRVLKPGGEAWVYDFVKSTSKRDIKQFQNEMKKRGVSRTWRVMIGAALRVAHTKEELLSVVQGTRFYDSIVEQINISNWPFLRARLRKPLTHNNLEHEQHNDRKQAMVEL